MKYPHEHHMKGKFDDKKLSGVRENTIATYFNSPTLSNLQRAEFTSNNDKCLAFLPRYYLFTAAPR